MHFDTVVSPQKLAELRDLVKRAGAREPIAYLVGRCEFYSLSMQVAPDCLIPRPETEMLVERAIEFLRARTGPQSMLDLCSLGGVPVFMRPREKPNSLRLEDSPYEANSPALPALIELKPIWTRPPKKVPVARMTALLR